MGELAALASSALWAFASILWTGLGRRTAPAPLNLIKTALATLILAALMPLLGAGFDASPMDLALLAASGLVGLSLGDTAYFHALQRIGPRRTLLLWTLTPFATALIAWPALGEPLTFRLLAAMAVTVGGVLVVVADRSEGSPIRGAAWVGVGFALLAVAGQSASNIIVKLAGEDIGALSSSVLRLAAGTAGLGLQLGALGRLAEVAGPFREPKGTSTVLVATLTGTVLGIWTSVYGVLHASQVAVASTLSSLSPVFVLPFTWWLMGERFGRRAVLGAVIAVAGVAGLSL